MPVCEPGSANVNQGLLDDERSPHRQAPGSLARSDVVADPVHEELIIRILEDEAHPPPDIGERVVVQGESTDHDFATLRTEQPVEVQRQVVFPEPLGPERNPFTASIVMSRPSKTGWCSPGYVKARSLTTTAAPSAPRS